MSENTPFGRILVPRDVPPGFALFYTTRDFPGFLSDDIARNLTRFIQERFGIESSLSTCTQVHGATASGARTSGPHTWRECDSCDALFSGAKQTALGIKVADCLPVTLIDPVHSVIANIHSGWRGAVQRITAETIVAIQRETKFDAAAAHAWLGPSIRVCCFEVGEEVAAEFDARYVDRSHAKPHVDIPRFTRDLLVEHGFAAESIIDTELCTRCEGSIFHSYRRDGKGGGRNLAIVVQ